jgi:enoyl-CoA hydratase/carnithine racemase
VVLLRQVKAEKDVHVILVTSGGPEFCTGIDISTLISDSIPVRKENARILANIIQLRLSLLVKHE